MIRKFVKYVYVCIMAGCILLGTGACGSRDVNNPGTTLSDTIFEQNKAVDTYYWDGLLGVTESGCLFPVDELTGGILEYYDFEEKEKFAFCSNVNCSHSDKKCAAWFDSFVAAPYVYEGQVLMFEYINDETSWNFISMDIDGTNRKIITKLRPKDFECDNLGSAISPCWYCEEQVVFKVGCEILGEENNENVMASINLKTGELKIYEKTRSAGMDAVGVYENKMLLSREDSQEQLLNERDFFEENGTLADYQKYCDEWEQNAYKKTYYTFDMNSGKCVDVFSDNTSLLEWDYSQIGMDGSYYYSKGNVIGKVDLEENTQEIIFESEEEISMESVLDEHLFFLVLDDNREKRLKDCCMDLATGEVTELAKSVPGDGWIYRETSKYFSGNGEVEGAFGYMFIPKTDYYNSEFQNMELIQAVE